MIPLQSVLPAKAGIPLLFDQIGGGCNFFTNSCAGMTVERSGVMSRPNTECATLLPQADHDTSRRPLARLAQLKRPDSEPQHGE